MAICGCYGIMCCNIHDVFPRTKKEIGSSHFIVVHAEAVFTKFSLKSATVDFFLLKSSQSLITQTND
jgi:hypothetical protein